MFILAATDDPLKLAPHSVDLYRDWRDRLSVQGQLTEISPVP